MITIRRQTTRRALVPTLAESLWYASAADTCLTCAGWVDFNDHARSLFRFRAQLIDKARPSCITDRLGDVVISHQALNVEILNRNESVLIHNLARFFVMKVAALIANVVVKSLQQQNCFASAIRSFLPTCYALLDPSQLGLRGSEPTRVLNHGPVAEGCEAGQPYVYPNQAGTERERIAVTLDSEQSEPPASLAFNGERLDLPFEWAVQPDPHITYLRDAQFIPVQCLSDPPKSQAVITAPRFETWIAVFYSPLHAGKKRAEGVMDPFQCILKSVGVHVRHVLAVLSNLRQLQVLIEPRDRFAPELPRVAPFLKRSVVKLAANSKLTIQRLFLPLGRVNPVTECLEHVGRILSFRFSV